MNVRLSLTADI